MREIKIYSKKFTGRYALIDDSDYELVRQFRWNTSDRGYAISWDYRGDKRVRISMHRLILGLTDAAVLVDHKDHNVLNNQRNNIRIATYGQNVQNTFPTRRSIDGLKGVTFNGENKFRKYCAVIVADGKRIFGGGFKNPVEAAYAWNSMALKYHGDFAYQNPITAIEYHDGTMYTVEKKTPCSTPIKDKDFIIEQVRTFVPYYRKRT